MLYTVEVSIIVPVYNEDESLRELASWIERAMEKRQLSYELLFVNDGSIDDSYHVIEDLCASHKAIKRIHFRKNYGKAIALNEGFKIAKGRVVVTMDADLQDSPDEITGLYEKITQEDYHLVSGWKKKRKDPLSKRIPSKLFNWVSRKFSKTPLHDFNSGLKAYKNEVVKTLYLYGEMHRYIPLLVKKNGFTRITEQVVAHYPRKYGHSKYGTSRLLIGLLDFMTVSFISRFKDRPMHFFGGLGVVFWLVGAGTTLYLVAQKIYRSTQGMPLREVVEQPLFYIALIAVIIGVQMFLTGFLAELFSSHILRKGQRVYVKKGKTKNT